MCSSARNKSMQLQLAKISTKKLQSKIVHAVMTAYKINYNSISQNISFLLLFSF